MNMTDTYINAYDELTGHRNEEVDELRCPVCGSSHITFADTEYCEDMVILGYVCDDCESEFDFRYELTGAYISKDCKNKED